jgi:hypothetical protein
VLVAAVDYSAATVTDLAGPIDTYAGIVRSYAEDDLTFTTDRFNGSYNNGEFEVAGSYIAPGMPVYLHIDHGHSDGYGHQNGRAAPPWPPTRPVA